MLQLNWVRQYLFGDIAFQSLLCSVGIRSIWTVHSTGGVLLEWSVHFSGFPGHLLTIEGYSLQNGSAQWSDYIGRSLIENSSTV